MKEMMNQNENKFSLIYFVYVYVITVVFLYSIGYIDSFNVLAQYNTGFILGSGITYVTMDLLSRIWNFCKTFYQIQQKKKYRKQIKMSDSEIAEFGERVQRVLKKIHEMESKNKGFENNEGK